MEDLDHGQLKMQEMTRKYVGILTEKWERIFATSVIPTDLEKLEKSAESFFLEVVKKTELFEKRVNAEQKIIKEEDAEVKVELASLTSEAPLAEFESSLGRRKRIERLLAEQDVLCEQLGEPRRSLRCDPLPTEQVFKSFSSHLDILRDERKGGAMSSVKSTASKPGPRIIASAIARRLSGRLSISHIKKRRLGRKKAPPSIAVNDELVLWSEIDKKHPPSGEKQLKHVNTSKENRISGQRSQQQQHRRIASPLAYVFNSRLMPTSPMPMRNRSPGLPLAHSPSCSAASNGRKLI